MRVVFDTNIYISFLLSKDNSSITKLLKAWEKGSFVVLLSRPILIEITRVLNSPKIRQLTQLNSEDIKDYLKIITRRAITLQPHTQLKLIKQDPTDNKFLNLAVDGRARYIISGDKHLLSLKKFKQIKITHTLKHLGRRLL